MGTPDFNTSASLPYVPTIDKNGILWRGKHMLSKEEVDQYRIEAHYRDEKPRVRVKAG